MSLSNIVLLVLHRSSFKIESSLFVQVGSQFSFLSPCPTSGLIIYGEKDELVPSEHINELNKRLSAQKGINVDFQSIPEANHFFSKTENTLSKNLDKYIKKETALF